MLWHAFLDLSMARGAGAFGPTAITYRDIDAYARLHRFKFTPWEVETIALLDLMWRADQAEQQKEATAATAKR